MRSLVTGSSLLAGEGEGDRSPRRLLVSRRMPFELGRPTTEPQVVLCPRRPFKCRTPRAFPERPAAVLVGAGKPASARFPGHSGQHVRRLAARAQAPRRARLSSLARRGLSIADSCNACTGTVPRFGPHGTPQGPRVRSDHRSRSFHLPVRRRCLIRMRDHRGPTACTGRQRARGLLGGRRRGGECWLPLRQVPAHVGSVFSRPLSFGPMTSGCCLTLRRPSAAARPERAGQGRERDRRGAVRRRRQTR